MEISPQFRYVENFHNLFFFKFRSVTCFQYLAERKSPIGYKAFAIAAIDGKQPIGEIVRYIEKVTSAETRYDLYCQAKFWKRALQEAAKLDDVRRMEYVKSQM